jgi:hypothetical protein
MTNRKPSAIVPVMTVTEYSPIDLAPRHFSPDAFEPQISPSFVRKQVARRRTRLRQAVAKENEKKIMT